MRFLMLNWRDPRSPLAGGAERVSLAFLKGLKDRGHTVDWFTFMFPGGAPEEIVDGIRVRRAGGVGSSLLAARRWVRTQPPYDLVIDQHHGIPWFAPWWNRGACLAYIHEVLGPIWGSFYRWPISWLGPMQERWTHRLYRRVPFWVPSESTRQALIEHGVREVRVLDNGVDLEPLPELDPKPPARPIRLIAVSRLAPNKRVDHALHCLRIMKGRGVPVALTVVGEGLASAALRKLACELGVEEQVRFVGYQPESAKAALLRDHHILLHPSVREGWGLNVIEANALGTPAVVYPVPGLVDSTQDRVTGVVCSGETPEALADGIVWLAGDPGRYEAIRQAAWRRSFQFRWKQVIPVACEFLEARASGGKMG